MEWQPSNIQKKKTKQNRVKISKTQIEAQHLRIQTSKIKDIVSRDEVSDRNTKLLMIFSIKFTLKQKIINTIFLRKLSH